MFLEIDGREARSGTPSLLGPPCRAPGKAPLLGDKKSPLQQEWGLSCPHSSVMFLEIDGREARSGTPSLLDPPCRAPGKAPLLGDKKSPLQQEWGLSCPHSSVVLLEIDGREVQSGDSVPPRSPLSGAWKGAPPRRQKVAAPGVGTFLSPLFRHVFGDRWPGSAEWDSVPPRSPLSGAWKGAPPRRQKVAAPGVGTFLSPLFRHVFGDRWPGSAEWDSVPPRSPLSGAWKGAPPRRQKVAAPAGVGTFLSPLFHLALGDRWPGSAEWDSVPPRSPLSGAWKGAPPRRQKVAAPWRVKHTAPPHPPFHQLLTYMH